MAGGAGIELVGDDAVFVFVDEVEKAQPKGVEFVLFEVALEQRVLDAHAEILASPGDLGEAFLVGDIVGDEDEHLGIAGWFALVGEAGEGRVEPAVGEQVGWRRGRNEQWLAGGHGGWGPRAG